MKKIRMNDKKRWVTIPNKGRFRLKSRKIDVQLAKVKVFDRWYVFDINNEQVVAQGDKWTEVINKLNH